MKPRKITLLTRELIIGFIEGKLSKSDAQIVEELINSSDRDFTEFSTLYNSYKEMQGVKLEKTPATLIKKAKEILYDDFYPRGKKRVPEFPPSQSVRQVADRADLPFGESDIKPLKVSGTDKKRYLNLPLKALDYISRPGVPLYSFISAVMVIVITLSIYYSGGDEKSRSKQPVLDPNFFNRFVFPNMDAAKHTNLEDISVSFEKNKLVISQPFRFDRKVLVYSEEGELLITKDIEELSSQITFPNIIKNDSIYVVITTMDSVVFKTVINIK